MGVSGGCREAVLGPEGRFLAPGGGDPDRKSHLPGSESANWAWAARPGGCREVGFWARRAPSLAGRPGFFNWGRWHPFPQLENLRFCIPFLFRTPTKGGKRCGFPPLDTSFPFEPRPKSENLRFCIPFLSEPRPKEENATVFLLWTPPFPWEYWVVPWRTDAKGTDLIDRVASSSDRRDVGLPSRSVETPFREITAASRHAQRQGSGLWGLDLLGLVGSRLVCCLGLF